MSYKCGYPDTMNKAGGTPFMQTKADIKKKKEYLKIAKENRKEYRDAKPWKKHESRTEDGKEQWYKEDGEWVESSSYHNKREYEKFRKEDDTDVQDKREALKEARKSYRKNRKNK